LIECQNRSEFPCFEQKFELLIECQNWSEFPSFEQKFELLIEFQNWSEFPSFEQKFELFIECQNWSEFPSLIGWTVRGRIENQNFLNTRDYVVRTVGVMKFHLPDCNASQNRYPGIYDTE